MHVPPGVLPIIEARAELDLNVVKARLCGIHPIELTDSFGNFLPFSEDRFLNFRTYIGELISCTERGLAHELVRRLDQLCQLALALLRHLHYGLHALRRWFAVQEREPLLQGRRRRQRRELLCFDHLRIRWGRRRHESLDAETIGGV